MTEKGYIKFNCIWITSKALPAAQIENLNFWRKRLHDLRLIGTYDNGIGYGNISARIGTTNQFIITGSNTGHLAILDGNLYTRVTGYDIDANSLTCEGPVKASSESLTHAALYQADPQINGVIHIHSLTIWQNLIDKVPTTSKQAEYGTPEMAREMIKISKQAPKKHQGIIVMGGHQEGIVTFGETLDKAGELLLQSFQK